MAFHYRYITVTLQALMMLRCDWRRPGVVEETVERLRRALGLLEELPRRAAELQCLQGALLQAVVAWHAAQQQTEAAAEAAAGAEGGAQQERRTLNSADGRRDDEGSSLLARLGPKTPLGRWRSRWQTSAR